MDRGDVFLSTVLYDAAPLSTQHLAALVKVPQCVPRPHLAVESPDEDGALALVLQTLDVLEGHHQKLLTVRFGSQKKWGNTQCLSQPLRIGDRSL